jgi:biotin carboxylase
MSEKAVLFAQPTRTSAPATMAEAMRQGYRVVALVRDPADLDKVWGDNRSVVERIHKVVAVGSWEDFKPDHGFLAALEREVGTVCGVFVNREEPIRAVNSLRHLLGLPTMTQRPEQLADIVNKFRLRTTLMEQGLSDLKYFAGRSANEWPAFPFAEPAIFKPMHGGGSRSVCEVRSLVELQRARQQWQASDALFEPVQHCYLHSGGNDYLLEEKVPGELLSVEGFTEDGRYQALGLTSRLLYSADATVELGHGFPYPHPERQAIFAFAAAVHHAVHWWNGFTHLEVIVRDERTRAGRQPFEAIDFNPRILGAFAWKNLTYALGQPIEQLLLRWAIGARVEIPKLDTPRCALIQHVLAPHGLDRLETLDLPDDPRVAFRVQIVPAGPLRNWGRADDRLGGYLVLGETYDEALRVSRALRSQVRINGTLPAAF